MKTNEQIIAEEAKKLAYEVIDLLVKSGFSEEYINSSNKKLECDLVELNKKFLQTARAECDLDKAIQKTAKQVDASFVTAGMSILKEITLPDGRKAQVQLKVETDEDEWL